MPGTLNSNIIESAKLFELITNNSKDLIIIYNTDFSIVYISPSVKRVLGFDPFEIIGKKTDEIFAMHEPLRSGEPQIMAYRHKHKAEKVLLESLIKPVIVGDKITCYLGISRDVDIRENLKKQLENELKREKAINETKSKFISMASHELKNPLATIASSLELLSIYLQDDDHSEKDKLEQHIERINTQLVRLNNIINEFLMVERTKMQNSDVKLETLDLVGFISNLLKESFNENYLNSIKIKSKEEKVYVNSNKILLFHIFKNLIENAIKYSKPDKLNIQVIIEVTEQHVEVSIKDNGIGVSAADKDKLFEQFYRSNNVTETSGFGIGLTIVQECAIMLNANVSFKSSLNKGSTFKVSLAK
jgi:PAS domain S-box-containing protein